MLGVEEHRHEIPLLSKEPDLLHAGGIQERGRSHHDDAEARGADDPVGDLMAVGIGVLGPVGRKARYALQLELGLEPLAEPDEVEVLAVVPNVDVAAAELRV